MANIKATALKEVILGEKTTNISFITKIEITNKTKIKIKAKTSKYKYNAYCIDSKIQRTKKLKK